jgi:hypothetical protein
VNFRQETSKNKGILSSVAGEKLDVIQGQIIVTEGRYDSAVQQI